MTAERRRCICRTDLEAEPATVERVVADHKQSLHHKVAWYAVEQAAERGLLRPALRRVA